MTLARMIRVHKVPEVPLLAKKGLREMEEADVEEVSELYLRYMKRFDMAPVMSKEELQHQFLSGRGTGQRKAAWKGRRQGQVVWTYVVEVSWALISCLLMAVAHHNTISTGS